MEGANLCQNSQGNIAVRIPTVHVHSVGTEVFSPSLRLDCAEQRVQQLWSPEEG